MWKGWIGASELEKELLEKLGVIVGEFEGKQFNNCLVSDDALDKLDKYWGQMFWGLEPIEVLQ